MVTASTVNSHTHSRLRHCCWLLTLCTLAATLAGVAAKATDNESQPASSSPSLTEDWHYGDHSVELKPYVVEFASPPVIQASARGSHRRTNRRALDHVRRLQAEQDRILTTTLPAEPKILNRYHYAYNGATVMLTDDQAEELRQHDDVLHVWEETFQQLLDSNQGSPTRTLSNSNTPLTVRGENWINSLGMTGEDIVVGIIDSGIVPENDSFLDDGSYANPPSSFVGTGCAFGNTQYNSQDSPFTCNNKLVAAKCYVISESSEADDSQLCGGDGSRLRFNDHFLSARDDATSGHGSHVASTAAGNANVTATIDGQVVGIISGVAPRARISVYKVCWVGSCGLSNTLAAIDDATADGVDVINYSIGGMFRNPPIERAYLNVMGAGITAVAAAGNSGPSSDTVGQPAALPWLVAVAASGNPLGTVPLLEITAPANIADIYEFTPTREGPQVTSENADLFSRGIVVAEPLLACSSLTNSQDMEGKVALVSRGECLFTEKFGHAAAAGAVAIIVYNNQPGSISMIVEPTVTIPGVSTLQDTGLLMANALENGETLEMAISFVSTNNVVAAFSSRGPNGLFSESIIKPDIIAPGEEILAASTPFAAGVPDFGRNDFGYLQGTSMASPHIAGVMALLKQAHPTWSPSAMKSAIMTTARQNLVERAMSSYAAPPMSIGSGFAVLENALDPGLIYDMTIDNHNAAYCGIDPTELGLSVCNALSSNGYSFSAHDMNYPSIAATGIAGSLTTSRMVTNVATNTLIFHAVLDAPAVGFDVTVTPCEFVLAPGASLTFEVTITHSHLATTQSWLYGSLTWVGREFDPSTTTTPEAESCSTALTVPPERKRYLRKNKKSKAETVSTTVAPSPASSASPSESPNVSMAHTGTDAPTMSPTGTETPSIAPSGAPSSMPFGSLAPSHETVSHESDAPSITPSSTPTTASVAPSPEHLVDESSARTYMVYSPIAVTFA